MKKNALPYALATSLAAWSLTSTITPAAQPPLDSKGTVPRPQKEKAPANKIKTGNSAKQDGATAEKKDAESSKSAAKKNEKEPDFGPYMSALQRTIKKQWFPPKGNESKRVVVIFKIYRDGKMSKLRIVGSSGVAAADSAAMDAVVKAAPFEALPEGSQRDVDIQFTFDYNVFNGSNGQFKTFGDAGSIIKPHLDPKKAKEHLDQAVTATGKDDFDKALVCIAESYNEINDSTPSHQLSLTAEAIAKRAPKERVILLLDTALAIDQHNTTVRERLDARLKEDGKDPKSPDVRLELAREARKRNDIAAAAVEYREAYALSPKAEILSELSRCYQSHQGLEVLGRWKTALESRNSAENHTGMAYAYELIADYARAEAEYKKALELEPNNEMAKQLLAALPPHDSAVTGKDPADACDLLSGLKEAASSNQSNQASISIREAALLNNAGVKLLNAGQFVSAIAKFKEALKGNPGYSYARDNLAIAYNNAALKAQPEKSLGYFHAALYLSPDNKTTMCNLDAICVHLGYDPKKGADLLRLAEKCEKQHDYYGAVIEYKRALIITKSPEIEAKLAECQKLVEAP